jgi:hypothetical protein
MEKSTRIIAQVYGYAVCLFTVITIVISISGLVTALMDRRGSTNVSYGWQDPQYLSSLGMYKLDLIRSYRNTSGPGAQTVLPSDTEIRAMYEAAKNYRNHSALQESNKSIVINSSLIAVCTFLFFTHWSWLRRIMKTA